MMIMTVIMIMTTMSLTTRQFTRRDSVQGHPTTFKHASTLQ